MPAATLTTGTRLLVPALGIAAIAIAAFTVPIAAWTMALAEGIRGAGAIGVGAYVLAYVAATIAGIPGSILTLAAGFAYGPVWGLAVASPASVAGATAAFLLGRTVLRDWAVRATSDSPRARAMAAAVEREGFKIVLLLRLSPVVPFNALNYVLSLTNVRAGTYVIASAIGMLPATALYVYLGSLAPTAAQLSTAGQAGGTGGTVLYVAGLLGTFAVVVIATRAAKRALTTGA
jgi:uncharacterized membrane protein YdjX (TVP38/TMEM64 family)